jgi:hypothetical protein
MNLAECSRVFKPFSRQYLVYLFLIPCREMAIRDIETAHNVLRRILDNGQNTASESGKVSVL